MNIAGLLAFIGGWELILLFLVLILFILPVLWVIRRVMRTEGTVDSSFDSAARFSSRDVWVSLAGVLAGMFLHVFGLLAWALVVVVFYLLPSKKVPVVALRDDPAEERSRIFQMKQAGTITAEECIDLLVALDRR